MAFLNVPYDKKYESLYLAFISGLCGFGLTPRAALEVQSSERRLDRILILLQRCRYSFHDLSRVEVARGPEATPRFNMPFELGLAVASAKTRRRRHVWYVFEAVPHRLTKSLSDLDGTDPLIHRAQPLDLLRSLTNVLVRSRHQPTMKDLETVYHDVLEVARHLKREPGSGSPFAARPFRDLVVAATRSAQNIIASLHT